MYVNQTSSFAWISQLLLSLCTFCQSAIIGGGIGGTSTAYFLRELFGLDATIDLYESDKIGGRLATIPLGNSKYESGGSVIHPKNKYMVDFVKQLGRFLLDLLYWFPPFSFVILSSIFYSHINLGKQLGCTSSYLPKDAPFFCLHFVFTFQDNGSEKKSRLLNLECLMARSLSLFTKSPAGRLSTLWNYFGGEQNLLHFVRDVKLLLKKCLMYAEFSTNSNLFLTI